MRLLLIFNLGVVVGALIQLLVVPKVFPKVIPRLDANLPYQDNITIISIRDDPKGGYNTKVTINHDTELVTHILKKIHEQLSEGRGDGYVCE